MPPTEETERKFLLGIDAVDELLARFYSHELVEEQFGSAGSRAFSRTTYLDTDDFALYRSSFTQSQRRVRIREYASAPPGEAPRLTGACFLELKTSSGTKRLKERYAATPAVVRGVLSGDRPADLPPALAQLLDSSAVAPKMTTWYRRFSLVDSDGKFRFTIDSDVVFGHPTTLQGAGELATLEESSWRVDGCIAEVKFAGRPPRWLEDAIAGLSEDPGFSKFRVGMEKVLDLR